MPLPEEYFNIINKGQEQGIYSYPGLYPDIQDEPDRELGNLFDLAGQAAWGASVGLTWGAAQLADPEWDKPWDKMNQLERVGYIAGEGLSLFAPWGPFGLMGKGSAKVAKVAGNKFIKKAAKKGVDLSSKHTNKILGEAAKVAKTTGQPIEKVVRGLGDDISSKVVKATKTDLGSQWTMQVAKGGVDAHQADLLLKASIDDIVSSSLKKAGVADVASPAIRKEIKHISDTMVKGFADGKYVNDIAEWVERGLGSRLPEGLARYLGMGVQDFFLMSAHGLANEAFRAADNGEDWHPGSAVAHSVLMAAAFPLIRRIPFGGEARLKEGFSAYFGRFRKTNYDKLLKDHGEDTMRKLMKIMLNGSKVDLNNMSRIAAGTWTVGGKQYGGAKLIEHVDTMPIKDLVTLFKRMNKAISQDALKHWRTRYLPDFAASLFRMGLGVLVMNYSVFKTGAFQDMDPGELAAHMMMSAMMTKGRGAWGRTESRAYMAEFTPYKQALDIINVDSRHIKSKFAVYDSEKIADTYGIAYSTDPLGMKIEQAFDSAFSETGGPEYKGSGTEFNMKRHGTVPKFIEIYNMIKRSKDPDYKPIQSVETMSRKQLNKITDNLESIDLGDGKTIRSLDHDWQEITVRLTKGPAKRMLDTYGRMLQSLGELGLPVRAETDTKGNTKITFKYINTDSNTTSEHDAIMRYNNILGRLESLKLAENNGTMNFSEINKSLEGREAINEKVLQSMRQTMDTIATEYGDTSRIFMDPDRNPYLDFISDAKKVELNDKYYKFMTGRGVKDSESLKLSQSFDAVFGLREKGELRYRKRLSDYEIIDQEKLTDAEREDVAGNLDFLRMFFGHRIQAVGATNVEGKSRIKAKDLQQLADMSLKFLEGFDQQFRENFHTKGLDIFADRYFGSMSGDPRSITIFTGLRDIGWGTVRGKQIELPDDDSLRTMAGRTGASAKYTEQVITAVNEIVDIIGKDHVSRRKFHYVDTERPDIFVPQLNDLLKLHQNITRDTIVDLYKNVRESLLKMNTGEEVGVVESKINNLLDTLASEVERLKNGGSIDIKKFEDINSQLEVLAKIGALSEVQRDTILTELEFIKEQVGEAKADVIKDGVPEEAVVENIAGDSLLSIRTTLKNVISEQVSSRRDMSRIVNNIINHITVGSRKMGLTQNESFEIIENLNRRLFEKMQESIGEAKKNSLSDTLIEFNKNLSWTTAKDILKGINEHVQKLTALNEGNSIYGDMAREVWETMDSYNKLSHDNRTPQLIRKQYGLHKAGAPNEWDPTFLRVLINPNEQNSVHQAFQIVRKKIYDNPELNKNEKDKQWAEFRDKDAYILANAILNTVNRDTVKFRIGKENEASLMDISPKGKHNRTLNDDFFEQYDVLWMDDINTLSIDGRPRQVSLDLMHGGHSNDFIQRRIINSQRISSSQREFMLEMLEKGTVDDQGKLNRGATTDPLLYLRLSPGVRILFAANPDNIKRLNDNYDKWYEKKRRSFRNERQRETFEQLFGHLVDESHSGSGNSLKLKLLMLHIDFTRAGQFNKYIKEYAGEKREATLAKLESDIWKRGYLSDGGTTQRMNRKVLRYMSRHHTNSNVKNYVVDLLDKRDGKLNTGIINEENFVSNSDKDAQGLGDSPFSIRRIVLEELRARQVEAQINNPGSPLAEALARAEARLNQIGEHSRLDSLDSSLFDGAKFVSENLARVIFAQKGGEGYWNGAKSILMQAQGIPGQSGLLGKGFIVYDPDIAARMSAKGLDMVVGVSVTKNTQIGKSIDPGKNLRPLEYTHSDRNLSSHPNEYIDGFMGAIRPENTMHLDVESIGISFTGRNSEGVHLSPSMFDWQPEGILKTGKEWMKLHALIENIESENKNYSNEDLLRQLHSLRENEGFVEESLHKMLIDWGANSQNPLVYAQVRRLFRNQDYEMLSNFVIKHGEDAYLTANTMNDLSSPLFMEIFAGQTRNQIDPVREHRKIYQYGGIGINNNLANRKLGNLQDVTFISRDADGVDITFTMNKEGKIDVASPFWDAYNGENNHVRSRGLTNVPHGNRFTHADFTSDYLLRNANREFIVRDERGVQNKNSTHVQRVKDLMETINRMTVEHNLSSWEVIRLLEGGSFLKKNKRIKLEDKHKRTASDFQVDMGANGNSIPKLAKDQPVFRIQKVLSGKRFEGKDGLVEVNHYDLRTTLQRDLDGDHFFVFTKVPSEMIRKFASDMGTIEDYPLYRKYIESRHINIFGINRELIGTENERAGHEALPIGFQQYAATLGTLREAIGSVISARRVMSWLETSQLQRTNVDGEYSNFLKNFILDGNNKELTLNSNEMQKMAGMLTMFQNSLDPHGGLNILAQDPAKFKSAMLEYFFYGKKPEWFSSQDQLDKMKDPNFESGIETSIFNNKTNDFGGERWGQGKNSEIQRQIFNILLRTMKQGNVIANDIWDEAGPRNPEPFELKKIHQRLHLLFNNPNFFIVKQLNDHIGMLRFKKQHREADRLRKQMVELFYEKDIKDVTDAEAVDEFMKKLNKGKIPQPKQIFKWNAGDGDTRMEHTIGGTVLNRLIKKNTYADHNMGSDLVSGYYASAGKYVDGVLSSISMMKAFGVDPSSFDVLGYGTGDGISIKDSSSKKNQLPSIRAKTAEHRGVVRGYLLQEYRNLNNELQYLSGDRFPNQHKVDTIEWRKSNVREAIDIIDRELAKDMLFQKDKLLMREWDQKKPFFKNRGLKPVMVFRIRSNAAPKLVKGYEGKMSGVEIDYGQLEKVQFLKKGGNIRLQPGYKYIIDQAPIIYESVNTTNAQYAHALFQSTYGNELSSFYLASDPVDRSFLIKDTQNVRYQISNRLSKTLDYVKKDKTQQFDFWEVTHTSEQNMIMKYFENNIPIISRSRGFGEFEATDALARFLIQPQAVGGKMRTDGSGDIDIPYYTINRRLTNAVFKYLIANGRQDIVQSITKEMEDVVAGRVSSVERRIKGYTMMYKDGYDFSQYGDMAQTVRTLTNHWFASPHLNIWAVRHGGKRYSDIQFDQNIAGDKVAIVREIPQEIFNQGCKL
jgi:hypothetical protein